MSTTSYTIGGNGSGLIKVHPKHVFINQNKHNYKSTLGGQFERLRSELQISYTEAVTTKHLMTNILTQ